MSVQIHVRLLAVAVVGLAVTLGGCGGTTQQNSDNPSSPTPSQTAEPTPTPAPEYQAFEDLEVGDCFDPVRDMDDDSLLAGMMLDCEEPHLMQVFGIEMLNAPAGQPYPGEAEVDQQAWDACLPAFEEFVGIAFDDSKLSASYYWPTPESWLAGDRSVLCLIEATVASSLTRSVEGSEL
jgi:hypothetical protein